MPKFLSGGADCHVASARSRGSNPIPNHQSIPHIPEKKSFMLFFLWPGQKAQPKTNPLPTIRFIGHRQKDRLWFACQIKRFGSWFPANEVLFATSHVSFFLAQVPFLVLFAEGGGFHFLGGFGF